MRSKLSLIALLVMGINSSQAAGNEVVRALVLASSDTTLASQMAGRIVGMNVKLGDRVKQGSPILRFDCDEHQAKLKMARAELTGAQHTLESKNKLRELESASVLEVNQAVADVDRLNAQIQLIQAQMRACSVAAPFSGRITKINIRAFESVSMGQPLIEMVNDSRLKMQINVPSSWLNRIKIGTPFTVKIDETNKVYQAKIRRINGKVDVVSQSIELEGEFASPTDGLLHGMSGTATF